MSDIYSVRPGTPVIVRDARGERHRMEATSGIEVEGHSFPVIWVRQPGGGGGRIPWPVEDVEVADE